MGACTAVASCLVPVNTRLVALFPYQIISFSLLELTKSKQSPYLVHQFLKNKSRVESAMRHYVCRHALVGRGPAQRIASHHITSHHITSHHIASHHITSHRITSHIASDTNVSSYKHTRRKVLVGKLAKECVVHSNFGSNHFALLAQGGE